VTSSKGVKKPKEIDAYLPRQEKHRQFTLVFTSHFFNLNSKGLPIMSTSAIEAQTTHTTIVPGPRAFFAGRCTLPPGINASYQPGSEHNPIVGTKALHQFKKDAAFY
jgi:hypothetical protein